MKIFVKAEVKKALFTEKSTAQLLDQLGMKKAASRIDANFPDTIVEKGASTYHSFSAAIPETAQDIVEEQVSSFSVSQEMG